jgi:xylulokinase
LFLLTDPFEDKTLAAQTSDFFSITDSPIWMDSSTTEHCKQLEETIGGPEKLTELTGSGITSF